MNVFIYIVVSAVIIYTLRKSLLKLYNYLSTNIIVLEEAVLRKFMIFTDMEGMPGVTSWDDVTLNTPEHDRFRLQLTTSVCDLCDILKQNFGDDTHIVVKDGHWTGRNILYELLPPGVKLVSGKITDQPIVMEQMDSTFDGVIFLYFHAPSPTLGNPLEHTENDEKYISFELNGKLTSELELFAHEAGFIGVPVLLVVGDDYTCKEAIAKKITRRVVTTKKGYGGSVESRSYHDILGDMQTLFNSYDAQDNICVKTLDCYELVVTYVKASDAYHASFFPDAILIAPNKVRVVAENYYEIRRAMMFI